MTREMTLLQRTRILVFCTSALLALVVSQSAQAQTYTVLYNFNPNAGGFGSRESLVIDASGNLYGTTPAGGDPSCNGGCGVVFKLDPSGNETVLHTFVNGTGDGWQPQAPLVMDAAGNLYGTTSGGGVVGYGTLFKIDTTGTETILYSFTGKLDGSLPTSLSMDASGNIYGVTAYGGINNLKLCGNNDGCGVLYKFSNAAVFTILHDFRGGTNDGIQPFGAPVVDNQGNVFGSTGGGGGANGAGIIFKLGSGGKYSVVNLKGSPGPNGPLGLSRDSNGNFYLPTDGGKSTVGTVIKGTSSGTLSAIFNFNNTDGAYPQPGLIFDSTNNLYGATSEGGSAGYGVIFKLDSNLNETVLYTLTDKANGQYFNSGLTMDSGGNLYGITQFGGTFGYGTIFKLTP